MDLSDPTRAVTSSLDGPVLAALAAAGRPLTVGQVAKEAARGSEIGIRRTLARLVEQGIVRAETMGRNQVHELNRDHVAAAVAEALAGLRNELWSRMRAELDGWRPRPLYACVFGSAARGDGDESSDIDLLLVHPPLPGERKPQRTVVDALGEDAAESWERQVDGLRERVHRWTGNQLQIVDLAYHEWHSPARSHEPLLTEVRRDGIELVRSGLLTAPRGTVADYV
jgi:predicted nucleotidyltransferase